MPHSSRRRALVVGAGALSVAALVAGVVTVPGAQAATRRSSRSTLAELRVADGGSHGPALLVAPAGRPVARPSWLPAHASPETVARAHLSGLAARWGVSAAPSSLRQVGVTAVPGLGPVVRFAQLVDGVPVFGAQLVVSLDASGDLQSVSGSTALSSGTLGFRTSAASARAVALVAASARLRLPGRVLRVGPATRYAYDPALVGGRGSAVVPVWRVVVVGPRGSSAHAEVLVDATTGRVARLDGMAVALRRAVCDAGPSSTAYLSDAAYGWCGENDTGIVRDTNNNGVLDVGDATQSVQVPYVRLETATPSSSAEVNSAYSALTDTAALYSVLGYDLTSEIGPTDATTGTGAGSTRTLAATVRSCNSVESYYSQLPAGTTDWHGDASILASADCPYGNAYWSDADYTWDPSSGTPYPGGQMFIGEGLAADDVIGHEMTHGVTSAISHLVYANQSGAINESMSDVFGQLVQELAAPGTDPSWLIGDELDGPVLFGAIRSMSDPTSTTLPEAGPPQPDSMVSANWATDPSFSDQGGVHTNSGVGNKAAYLIAHGGTFRGVSVARLDQADAADSVAATTKTAWLYWTVQNLLPSNADYRLLGTTLDQACRQLAASPTDTHGFVLADCTGSVDKAVAATAMTLTHATTSVTHTAVTYGHAVTVSGRITGARGAVVAGTAVRLEKLPRGSSTWSTVVTGTTGSAGTKTWSVVPAASTYYRVVQVGSGAVATTAGASRLVGVVPTVTRKVSASRIKYRGTFRVRGTVTPGHVASTVHLQWWAGGAWHTLATANLSSASTYSLRYRARSRADRYYRVQVAGGTRFVSGVSAKFFVTVT